MRMLVWASGPFHHLHLKHHPFPKLPEGSVCPPPPKSGDPVAESWGRTWLLPVLCSPRLYTYTQSQHIQIVSNIRCDTGIPRLMGVREEEVDLRKGRGRSSDLQGSSLLWGLG